MEKENWESFVFYLKKSTDFKFKRVKIRGTSIDDAWYKAIKVYNKKWGVDNYILIRNTEWGKP